MTKVLALLLLMSALGASVWVAKQDGKVPGSAESKTPADVVSEYCQLAERGDFLGFRSVERDGQEWEFFLHKEDQRWLIFKGG